MGRRLILTCQHGADTYAGAKLLFIGNSSAPLEPIVRISRGQSWFLVAAALFAVVFSRAALAQTIQFPRTGNIYSPPASSTPAFSSPPPATSPYNGSPGTAAPPSTFTNPPSGYALPPGSGVPRNVVPPAVAAPINPAPSGAQPGAMTPGTIVPGTVGTPVPFDPYSTSPGGNGFWPSGSPLFGAPAGAQPAISAPGGWTTPGGAPAVGPPGTTPFMPPASPFVNPSPGTLTSPSYAGTPFSPGVGNPAATQTPSSIYPGGLWSTNPAGQPYYDWNNAVRVLQDLRMRHTYLVGGDDPTDLGINDTEVAVTLTWPDFLWSQQPLFISPAFALHLWDGPIGPPYDLPGSAYSAYLDFQWASDPNLQLGLELGARIGVYSDFDTMNTDSLRLQGVILGRARLTPTLTFKLGAMYLDRNDIKILPAGGFVWQPSSQVRFDILFPNPKLAQYITTVGTAELWWYVAGEYGGGAWTIERADGSSDRIDINDIRVMLGLEWTGQRVSGFVEAGIVFEREVIYVVDPSDSFDADDTFMVRAGISL